MKLNHHVLHFCQARAGRLTETEKRYIQKSPEVLHAARAYLDLRVCGWSPTGLFLWYFIGFFGGRLGGPSSSRTVGVEKSRLGGSDAVFTGTDFVCLGNGSPETIELRLRSGKRVNYRPVASRRNRRIAGYFSSHLTVRATAPTKKKFSLCGRLVAGYSRDQRNLCMASRPRFASMASIHTTG